MKERRDVFFAIADEHRREVLMLLARENRPLSIATIANDFKISRYGVSKHIKILSESGLVTTEFAGRENYVSLQAQKLEEVFEWVSFFEAFWKVKLSKLKQMVESKQPKKGPP
jgi:DNA-binding transcriptional ArsR family regulator